MGASLRSCARDRWMCWMMLGEFEQAWRVCDELDPRAPRLETVTGRSVHVRCKHGLGDTIQFLRYLPLLRDICDCVSIAVQPPLACLVRNPGMRKRGAVQIECMQLAHLFRTTVETIPAPFVECRMQRRQSTSRLYKVGLVWASGRYDPARSTSLAGFADLARVPGVEFHSLQHGPQWRQALNVPAPVFASSAEPKNDDIGETVAAILGLDLIISVDTMVAHLAASLGVPVFLLLPFRADWRWMVGRDDSPWYPTMRLFRQTCPGDWGDPMARLRDAMASLVRMPRQRTTMQKAVPPC
jgi:hypothetical protein